MFQLTLVNYLFYRGTCHLIAYAPLSSFLETEKAIACYLRILGLMEGFKESTAYLKYSSFTYLEIRTLMMLGIAYRRLNKVKKSVEVFTACLEQLRYLLQRNERFPKTDTLTKNKYENLVKSYHKLLSLVFLNISSSLEHLSEVMSCQAIAKIAWMNLEDCEMLDKDNFVDSMKMHHSFLNGKVPSDDGSTLRYPKN